MVNDRDRIEGVQDDVAQIRQKLTQLQEKRELRRRLLLHAVIGLIMVAAVMGDVLWGGMR